MLHRVAYGTTVVFTEGVAKNQVMAQLLQDKPDIIVQVRPVPDIAGALGAALYALEGNGGHT